MSSLASLTTAEAVTVVFAVVFAILLWVLGFRAWKRARVSPEDRERRRREILVAAGKMGDATLMEVHENVLVYSYDVRGIEYTASQEIALLKEYMPSDLSALQSVSVKYDARNPANSIIVAERWTGLRARKVS